MSEYPQFSQEQTDLVMAFILSIHKGDTLHYADNDRASAYSDIDNNIEDLIGELFKLWRKPLYRVVQRNYGNNSDKYWVVRVTDGVSWFSSKDEDESVAKCAEMNAPFIGEVEST